MHGFGAKIILDCADNDRISALKQWTGWELKWVENHLMKRRLEVSQHCWKFIYKHSDISIFAVCHLFYFLYFFLPA